MYSVWSSQLFFFTPRLVTLGDTYYKILFILIQVYKCLQNQRKEVITLLFLVYSLCLHKRCVF